MLIRVNEKTWIRADDIEKISIFATKQIENPEIKFGVCIKAGDEEYATLVKSFKDAENFATQLAEKINSEEWY